MPENYLQELHNARSAGILPVICPTINCRLLMGGVDIVFFGQVKVNLF